MNRFAAWQRAYHNPKRERGTVINQKGTLRRAFLFARREYSASCFKSDTKEKCAYQCRDAKEPNSATLPSLWLSAVGNARLSDNSTSIGISHSPFSSVISSWLVHVGSKPAPASLSRRLHHHVACRHGMVVNANSAIPCHCDSAIRAWHVPGIACGYFNQAPNIVESESSGGAVDLRRR